MDVAPQVPGTHVVWLLRRGQVGDTFGGGDADQLPARGALGGYEQVRSVAAAAARVELVLPDTGVCGGAGLFDQTERAG